MEDLILPPLEYPRILWENDVNVNRELKKAYVEQVLPSVCVKAERAERAEAQENYGSAATADVNCLQSLSRRIHFGKFVAESKILRPSYLSSKPETEKVSTTRLQTQGWRRKSSSD